ncbi:hypothetical protein Hdeb2414_s0511g00907921 [Helianthus debilis subsp. tardiflorus]
MLNLQMMSHLLTFLTLLIWPPPAFKWWITFLSTILTGRGFFGFFNRVSGFSGFLLWESYP